jgi:putative addiction module component (TIGR02574 family)
MMWRSAVSALPPELAGMSPQEKLDLIELLWASIPEAKVPVPDFHRRIIAERMAEFEADPNEGEDWEDVKAELEGEP